MYEFCCADIRLTGRGHRCAEKVLAAIGGQGQTGIDAGGSALQPVACQRIHADRALAGGAQLRVGRNGIDRRQVAVIVAAVEQVSIKDDPVGDQQ